jgi:uncharacterized protein DUF6916
MLESFTRDTFAGRVGEQFRLRLDEGVTLELELAVVTDLSQRSAGPPRPGAARRSPFSLLFRGPRDPVLPQRMYPLEHEGLGSFELFLVPVGRDQAGTQYEAIFT